MTRLPPRRPPPCAQWPASSRSPRAATTTSRPSAGRVIHERWRTAPTSPRSRTTCSSHTERLVADSRADPRERREAYYELAESAGLRLRAPARRAPRRVPPSGAGRRRTASRRRTRATRRWRASSPGVPSLAEYDVIIDAGGDASDPENAVPFDVETPAGRTFKQPGNFNFLIETAAFGTEPKFQAKGVEPDLDGDGKVEFGESLPDADFYVAAARDFERYAKELDAAAREWEPTPSDALTALVVMTPTMSEYFEAWKNSRFIAGERGDREGVRRGLAARRTSPTSSAASCWSTTTSSRWSRRRTRQQAQQTEESLRKLHAFAAELRDQEATGRKYTAEEADTLGSQAQERAEAIAGQITQAAAQAGHRDRRGLTRRALLRCGARSPRRHSHGRAAPAAAPAAAAAEAAPPWQAAQRMQDLVFDAQSALLLDEPRSAVRLVRRAARQLRGPLAQRPAARRPARCAPVAVALSAAGAPPARRDEIGLRGGARPPARRAPARQLRGHARRGARRRRPARRHLAAAARVPQGHPLHPPRRRRHARRARAWRAGRSGSAAGAVSRSKKDLLDAYQARLVGAPRRRRPRRGARVPAPAGRRRRRSRPGSGRSSRAEYEDASRRRRA